MFGVRNWLTPMHSTSSLAFSIFLARFSPIWVGIAFLRKGSTLPSIPRFARARNARWSSGVKAVDGVKTGSA